jgi:hypothetical protein
VEPFTSPTCPLCVANPQSAIENRQFFISSANLCAPMRAAAILGLGRSEIDLQPFQSPGEVEWLIGLPAARTEADIVLVLGGDGTVHRHLSQLVRLQLPVLVVPHGSGNDFARALGLGRAQDSFLAWKGFRERRRNIRPRDNFAPGGRPGRGGRATRNALLQLCCRGRARW